MGKKVFISYSFEDKKYAKKLAEHLSKLGVSAWAGFDINAGTDFAESIQKSLDESSAVLVILTDSWKRSEWAAFELGAAFAKGKTIIPILLSKDTKDIPSILNQFAYVDATKKDDKTIAKIIEKIIK